MWHVLDAVPSTASWHAPFVSLDSAKIQGDPLMVEGFMEGKGKYFPLFRPNLPIPPHPQHAAQLVSMLLHPVARKRLGLDY